MKLLSLKSTAIRLPTGLLIVLLSLVIRFALSPLPGYDVREYGAWAEVIARGGMMGIYHADLTIPYNYPPVYLYVLDALGRLYSSVSPSFDTTSVLFGVLLKTPAILADAAIALAIYLFLRGRISSRSAIYGALAYALNPAVIWNTAYWGGIDAINALFAFLSLALLTGGRPAASWSLLTLSVLTKPLSAPVAVVVVFLTLRRFGLRRTILASSAAMATVLVVALPFLLSGTFGEMVRALASNVGNYDNITANAHNFWWLVSGGYGWTKDTTLLFGAVSYRVLGFALFVLFALSCLYFLHITPVTPVKTSLLRSVGAYRHRSAVVHLEASSLSRSVGARPEGTRPPPRWGTSPHATVLPDALGRVWQESHVFYAGALLSFAFYMLPTEVHENWMFGAFPFLAVAAALEPRFRMVFVALSVTFGLNLALHDLSFGYELPAGRLGYFLAFSRMANSAANNVILVYGIWLLLPTTGTLALARRLVSIERRRPDTSR